MNPKHLVLLIAAAIFLGEGTAGAQTGGTRTVWDGVYSEAQASRGETAFMLSCARCHGDLRDATIDSPLRGEYFMDRWREDTLDTFFTFVQISMPPPRRRGTFPRPDEQSYLDILAYIMRLNGFPVGPEPLVAETVPQIRLVGADGPKPLPSSSLVQLVGCLVQIGGDAWNVINASEPGRTREPDGATDEELTGAAAMPLGVQTFRLSNLGYLGPDFPFASRMDQKLLVKGYVIRQPGAERINVTLLEPVAPSCSE